VISVNLTTIMATVAEYVNDFIERREDKRVSDWIFMSSAWPTATIILIYLALVYGILPAYMKNRKPYSLTTIIRTYNVIQIVSCVWLVYWFASSGWVQGKYHISCEPIDYSSNPQALGILNGFYWTYFLKMFELLETVFFILRKKSNQVTKLHVYHHASTIALAYIGCKFVGGAVASVPIMLNSFIHILMYTYYLLSSLGPTWQKKLAPWKPRLTMAQMVQFTLLIIQALMTLQPNCDVPHSILFLYVPNVVLIYKMFYDFYKANYTQKKETKKQH